MKEEGKKMMDGKNTRWYIISSIGIIVFQFSFHNWTIGGGGFSDTFFTKIGKFSPSYTINDIVKHLWMGNLFDVIYDSSSSAGWKINLISSVIWVFASANEIYSNFDGLTGVTMQHIVINRAKIRKWKRNRRVR